MDKLNDIDNYVPTDVLGYTRIYISVGAETLDYTHLESVFGLMTDINHSWKKGDPWRNTGRIRSFSHWASESVITKSPDLDKVLIEFIKPFKDKKQLIHEIKEMYEANLFLEVVPYIKTEGVNQIMPQSLELMAILVELQLPIDIDYYIED